MPCHNLFVQQNHCEQGLVWRFLVYTEVRDCLVVGIKDQTLSERLQMEPDLTLDKAKKMV